MQLTFAMLLLARASSALTLHARGGIAAPRCAVRLGRALLCDAAAPAASATAAADAPPPEPAFPKLDVRVGKIVEAWPHPDSEKLWCERIDVGEGAPREIASGIRAYYAEPSDLEGRSVLVVCNLKPAKLGGFPSNGMVLCGTSADGSVVEFVEPPAESPPGERVRVDGATMPDPASPNQVKKKKLLETATADLRAADGVATYQGAPLVTNAGPCRLPTIGSGTIS